MALLFCLAVFDFPNIKKLAVSIKRMQISHIKSAVPLSPALQKWQEIPLGLKQPAAIMPFKGFAEQPKGERLG